MDDEEIKEPVWSEGSRVHNWRNHVGENTKKIWRTFSLTQKRAIAADADDRASAEEWWD